MPGSLFLDICHLRLRYLSRASQISVSYELDITKKSLLYYSILYYLKDINSDDYYAYQYSILSQFKYYYKYLINNILLRVLLYQNGNHYNRPPS